MSNTKRFAVVLMAEFLLLIIGLFKVSFTSTNTSTNGSDFTVQYMLGYSIPIVSVGMVAFFCCVYILKEPKAVSRVK